ncbi:hypothetical protein ACU4HD_28860 [Cupriavidus basilensis]
MIRNPLALAAKLGRCDSDRSCEIALAARGRFLIGFAEISDLQQSMFERRQSRLGNRRASSLAKIGYANGCLTFAARRIRPHPITSAANSISSQARNRSTPGRTTLDATIW